MFHTQNTVRRAGRGRRLPDAMEQFRALGRDTLGGVRTAAARILKQTADIDLSPKLEDAILYGPIARPIDSGQQAQLNPVPLGYTPRNVQASGATQHRAARIPNADVPTQIWVPPRPVLLQGATFSSLDDNNDIVWGHNDSIQIQPTFDEVSSFLLVEEEAVPHYPIDYPLGIPGVLISPDTGLWHITELNVQSYQVTIRFTEAILMPGPC